RPPSPSLAGRPRHRTHQRTNKEPAQAGATMKRFLRKIFKRKPKYEPAAIVHYGEWRFGDYDAQATPHGTHHVWHHEGYQREEQCATCFENGGAIRAVEAPWPCDIYTTIQDAIGDQNHDR